MAAYLSVISAYSNVPIGAPSLTSDQMQSLKQTTFPCIAVHVGPYSGGIQRMFSVSLATQCSFTNTPRERFWREVPAPGRRFIVSSSPLSVLRDVPSLENERVRRATSTSSVWRAAPEPASHSLTVSLYEADASSLPSGEKATALIGPEWPSSVCRAAPEPAAHSLTVQSLEADASSLLSGEKAPWHQ